MDFFSGRDTIEDNLINPQKGGLLLTVINKITCKPVLSLAVFFLISLIPVSGETIPAEQKYIIRERSYIISGLTASSSLEKELNLPDSPEFTSTGEMEQFVSDLEQELHNLRLFSDIKTELIPLSSDETVKLFRLEIHLKDAWTFIPLFYPKYDTNTGYTMESKILYSNFFGTLMNFEMDSYVEIPPPEVRELEGIRTGQWEMETSLGNIHWGARTYSFEWLQKYDRVTKNNSGTIVEDFTFYETQILTETAFSLPEDFTYKIAPVYTMRYSYEKLLPESSLDREPFALGINQNLLLDRMDWAGNFRQGYTVDLGLESRYSFSAAEGLKLIASVDARWFRTCRERYGLSLRGFGLTSYQDEQADLGFYMRGVPDENLYGHSGLFFNSGISVKSLDWEKVVELQMEPFLDGGITFREAEPFSAGQDLRLASGFSFLFFFDRFTSVQIRTTFGWDLLSPGPDQDRFEFLLSTSLFY